MTTERARPDTDLKEPPAHIVELAVNVSGWSPCQSKRGAVIFRGENIISHGHNFKPKGFKCDGSNACKSTCRREAIHAEQSAVCQAGAHAYDADMLHVKSIDGKLVPSGGPSCVECSKLALAFGIAGFWLYHEDGWKRYEMAEFHRLSLAARASSGPQEKEQHELNAWRELGEEMARIVSAMSTEQYEDLCPDWFGPRLWDIQVTRGVDLPPLETLALAQKMRKAAASPSPEPDAGVSSSAQQAQDPILLAAKTERAVIVDYIRGRHKVGSLGILSEDLFAILAAEIEEGWHYPPLPESPSVPPSQPHQEKNHE